MGDPSRSILILAKDSLIASALSIQILKDFDVSVDISDQIPAPKGHGAHLILVVADFNKLDSPYTSWAPKLPGDSTETLILGDGSSSDSTITFINKPVRIAYLIARLASLLGDATEQELVLGSLRLTPDRHTITDPQNEISLHLSNKETAILKMLAEAMPNFVSRHQLLRNIWGYQANVQTHTLETHIHQLRRKLANMKGIKLVTTHTGSYVLKLTTQTS